MLARLHGHKLSTANTCNVVLLCVSTFAILRLCFQHNLFVARFYFGDFDFILHALYNQAIKPDFDASPLRENVSVSGLGGLHSGLKDLMIRPLRSMMCCRSMQFLEGQQSLTFPHFVPVQGKICTA